MADNFGGLGRESIYHSMIAILFNPVAADADRGDVWGAWIGLRW